MKLIQHYVDTVASYLSSEQRDDISAELYSSLSEQYEEQCEDQTQLEDLSYQEAFLQTLEHPLKAASHYSEHQYLIGPNVFPAYWHVLKTAAYVFFALFLVLLVVDIVTTSKVVDHIADLFPGFFSGMLMVFALVTAVFVAIERTGQKLKWFDEWEPSSLVGSELIQSRSSTVFNLVSELVVLIWWNDLASFTDWLSKYSGVGLELTPQWQAMTVVINLLLITGILWYSYRLVQVRWTKKGVLFESLLNLVWIILLLTAILGTPMFVIPEDFSLVAHFDQAAEWMARTIQVSLGIIVAILGWETFELFKKYQKCR
ncbi:hypothetical protein [Pleionea sp. CnH1-48]|uniref:hypothetical protein n=1 Tax=Pleionea sp. CnH1-48 TaxID=2954494 RepID=UPI002097FBF2|nr:hypothetical protein [Pleionea sp. CnH1-48]MCO7225822.1 hypothetical protein [Pleionea sp. CnH1-48]